ncbi:hypothetical protein L484_018203 [Morus notabilis]|uniref:Uncharacterized protein n=1 Tax=Morus notabilis TaxID=981085 RepID=W9QFR5_9ROSA|nr:hypothetical protein L484_018203 [Morus notabilis]
MHFPLQPKLHPRDWKSAPAAAGKKFAAAEFLAERSTSWPRGIGARGRCSAGQFAAADEAARTKKTGYPLQQTIRPLQHPSESEPSKRAHAQARCSAAHIAAQAAALTYVREFYANAKFMTSSRSMVRKTEIKYDARTINKHLDIPVPDLDEINEYIDHPYLDEVVADICPRGCNWSIANEIESTFECHCLD